MVKFIIIAVILVLIYGLFFGLMKAAGKKAPSMPDIEEESKRTDK